MKALFGILIIGILLSGCSQEEPLAPAPIEPAPSVPMEPAPNETIMKSLGGINLENPNETIELELNNTAELDMVCLRNCIDRDITKCMDEAPFKKEGDIYIYNLTHNWTEQDLENYCTFDVNSTERTDYCKDKCTN